MTTLLTAPHPIIKTEFTIEGAPVVYVHEGRISLEERHEELFYYSMRHDENDWSEPCTIEIGVMVNFFGVLVTSAPIPSLTPKPGDSENEWYRIPIHPEEEPANAYIQEAIMHFLQGDFESLSECLAEAAQPRALKCKHCNKETIESFEHEGTFIYVCSECPNVTFEYSSQKDIDNLNDFLNTPR